MLGLYPLALIVLLVGVLMFDWMAEAAESQPQEIEDFSDRDADDLLNKLGIDDMEDLIIEQIDEDMDIFIPEEEPDVDEEPDSNNFEEIDDVNTEDGVEPLDNDESEMDTYYYYSTLSEDDKKLYVQLYERCMDIEATGGVRFGSIDDADRIFNLVCGDHPELFFVNGYHYTIMSSGVALSPLYAYSNDEIASRRLQNNMVIDEVISAMPGGLSEYEIIKYCYEWIVNNTTYDLGSADNQEYSSVFINHSSVCAGYANAMIMLLQKAGLQAMYVTGNAPGPHAWAIVRVDGQYYQLDVTWADSTNPTVPHPDYAYLCMTTEKISRTHTVDDDIYPIPECNSMDANFYLQEGLYVSNIDYDELQEMFDKSKLEYNGVVHIMASDAGTYKALVRYLLDDGNVYSLYYGDSQPHNIMYCNNDNLYTLSFYR